MSTDCGSLPSVADLVAKLRAGKADRVDMDMSADAMELMAKALVGMEGSEHVIHCSDCRKKKGCKLHTWKYGLNFCSKGEPEVMPRWPMAPCPYNEAVQCDGGWCESCGWREAEGSAK